MEDFWERVDQITLNNNSHVILMVCTEHRGVNIGQRLFKVYRSHQLASLRSLINNELGAFQDEDDSLTFVANGSLTENHIRYYLQRARFETCVMGRFVDMNKSLFINGQNITVQENTWVFENKDFYGMRTPED